MSSSNLLTFLLLPYVFALGQTPLPISITTDKVLATTGNRFAPAFGLEMWQMLSMLTNNDFTDSRLLKATSALAGSTIRIGGITADWLCYITDSEANETYTSKSSKELSELALKARSRLEDFWPSQCENITMPQFRTLLGFFDAAGWDVVFDLNELHGRNCTNPDPNYPESNEWCSGEWDTSNAQAFLQYLHDNSLVGGSSALFGFELGNELVGHLNYTANIQDILTLVDMVKSIWSNEGDNIPPVYAPSTDNCYVNDTFTIMNSIADFATGFTYHAYPGGSGTGIDNFTSILLNTTWLRTGILTGSDSINCINQWINGGSKAKGLDLWITESSASWNFSLTEPAQDSFIHGFFTIPELGQYAQTGVNMVARWSFSEGSPFGTIKYNSTAQQWDASTDYYILITYNTVVGHRVLQVQGTENSDTALVYAHCSTTGQGQITLLAVNPTEQSIQLNPTDDMGNALPLNRVEYIFTSVSNDFSSYTPLLNGEGSPLRLGSDGTPPIMPGKVVTDSNAPLVLPPFSQAFIVLLGANASACQ